MTTGRAGATAAYQTRTAGLGVCPASRQLVADMTALLTDYESQLRPGERVPISTEILESSFALYKQLEQQHSKSGFTNRLLAFPTLLRETTAAESTTGCAAVKFADVKAWTRDHLPETLASQRHRLSTPSPADH